jgi:hypothetical protein
MKKVVILALIPVVVIVLIVIISKNEKDTVVNMSDSINDLQISTIAPEQLNTLEGISLVHVEYDSDNSEIKFILQNKTRHNIYFGEEIILEKKQKDEWYLVPYSGEIGFTDILNYLSPSEESERNLPINVWIPITDGEYRIIKEVSLQEGLKSLHYISTDFTITK